MFYDRAKKVLYSFATGPKKGRVVGEKWTKDFRGGSRGVCGAARWEPIVQTQTRLGSYQVQITEYGLRIHETLGGKTNREITKERGKVRPFKKEVNHLIGF